MNILVYLYSIYIVYYNTVLVFINSSSIIIECIIINKRVYIYNTLYNIYYIL